MTPSSPEDTRGVRLQPEEASFHGRRVLVTGGTGFVGRHIAAELQAQGARVLITVHERPVPPELGSVETVRADLTRAEDAAAALAGVDDVFHCAGAVSGAGASSATVVGGIATNLVLTARVLEAVAAAGVPRCLVFSSSTIYPESDRPLREEDGWSGPPPAAYEGYGWMRRYVEKLAQLVAHQSSTKMAIVRPTAIYGRHDTFDPRSSHFVAALIRRAVAREAPFEVWGTGEETRDLLHVSDLARGCLLAMENYAVAEPINIGAGRTVTVAEVARLVLDAAGYADADLRFNPSKPVTIARRAINCSKARDLLGFTPAVPLTHGLRDTVAWYIGSDQRTNDRS